eukprot:TRINITY_DN4623_c0_g1_i1.p1 TRINITY_DN4623_c0_g1~~TRINITY_DN4623_c0_g1_i1.p1  ORF type:complete len:275 (+),score=62.56 TRINITY_DN4623_c0_g1_i1:54-878(+)
MTQHTTQGDLFYLGAPQDGSKPWINVNDVNDRNFTDDIRTTIIRDIRTSSNPSEFTTDTSGFQVVPSKSTFTAFDDEARITSEYYQQTVDLIKAATGASRVYIFDHTIRKNLPDRSGNNPNERKPVQSVHVDQTPQAAVARLHRHLGDEAPALQKKRFQLINVWRPIDNPAIDFPLTVCDYRSVDQKDLFPTDLRYPHMTGEIYRISYNPNQRWYYQRNMTVDETFFIKCYDSEHFKDASIAAITPHTAFVDPETPKDAPARQSIEVRSLVFYD